ncbi:MAG TPA: histidine kinase [Solirubrobacterales bacterium]|nr:histidine kinase [Solirubrobacterales bacterium]
MSRSRFRRAAMMESRTADVVLALALLAGAELEIWAAGGVPGPSLPVALAAPAMTLPLAWRRRAPLAAFLCVYAAYLGQAIAGGIGEQSVALAIALLVSIYSVAVHAGRDRMAVAGLVLGQSVAWGVLALEGGHGPGDWAFSLLLGAGAWLGGYAVRSGHLVAERLTDRAQRVEAESAEERKRALAEQRAMIAREMHDVVAHGMSVAVVQAGAARQLIRDDPQRCRELLLSVESGGRQALTEMRRLVGLARLASGAAESDPQPGLGQVDELVRSGRESGVDLSFSTQGTRQELAPGLDLAAYRIVQEAITNAIKHAAPCPAELSVRYGREHLELELSNPLPGERSGEPGGHGLIGMRERASLYGGTIEVADRDGRFVVRVRLPLEESMR